MVTGSNGKSARRDRIKAAAQIAAQKATAIPSQVQIIDVKHPTMVGAENTDIDVFDVHDGRPRVMFLLEHLSNDAKIDQGRTAIIHTLRWNCDPFGAHSIVVDGVSATRGLELDAVKNAQNQIQQHIEQGKTQANIVDGPNNQMPVTEALAKAVEQAKG